MNSPVSQFSLDNLDELPLFEVDVLLNRTKVVLPSYKYADSLAPSTLIVAPHPDDETLGCGGAIALLRSLGCPVQVLVVSDGTSSHPNSRKYPLQALRNLREQETRAALAILKVEAEAITFLGLPDKAVPTQQESGWQDALSRCQVYLSQTAPSTIFLPWRHDPHRDHRASWQLIDAAAQGLTPSPRLIEYPIWDWDLQKRGVFSAVRAWRLNINCVWQQKQEAIAQYRSQITNLIDDDPQGFRLTAEMLENFALPWEIYLERDD